MDNVLIVPEAEVSYKYYFKGGMYVSKGYMLLSDLMDNEVYSTHFNDYNMPVLVLPEQSIISEEHIESYILAKNAVISIYIDPVEPFRSEIGGIFSENFSLKSN
jgi:hypothetical protein